MFCEYASSCSLSLDEPRLIHNQKRFTLHVTELLFTYERTAGRRPTHWASREYGSPTYQPDTWKPRRCPSIDKAPSINQINAGHESVYSAPFHLPLRSQRNLVLCCCPSSLKSSRREGQGRRAEALLLAPAQDDLAGYCMRRMGGRRRSPGPTASYPTQGYCFLVQGFRTREATCSPVSDTGRSRSSGIST